LNQSKQAPFHKKTVSPDGFFMFARAFTFATRMKAESERPKAKGKKLKLGESSKSEINHPKSEILFYGSHI
jgi:hypothetical protein